MGDFTIERLRAFSVSSTLLQGTMVVVEENIVWCRQTEMFFGRNKLRAESAPTVLCQTLSNRFHPLLLSSHTTSTP